MEIINHLDYGNAVLPIIENEDIGMSFEDVSVWNRPRVLDENLNKITENEYYSIRRLTNNSKELYAEEETENITEFTRQYPIFEPIDNGKGNSIFYDTYWTNIFLDYFPYGCKLYAGETGQKRLNIWKHRMRFCMRMINMYV